MAAQSDWASLACLKRHIASSSFWGSSRLFLTSRYAERVLIPGVEEGAFPVGIRGAGGAGGKGEEEFGDERGVRGAFVAGIEIEAFFFK